MFCPCTYFDDERQPLTVAAGAAPPANAIYTASIVPATTNTSLITADASTANSVACLQINIVTDPGHLLPSSGSPSQTVPANLQSHCTSIPVFLANNGN